VKYLLDTDTFSALVRGTHAGLLARIEAISLIEIGISVVTRGEVLFGQALHPLRERTLRRMEQMLGSFVNLPMPLDAARHYAHIRAHLQRVGTPIGPNDLWIASHALAEGLVLVTHNTREFKRVPGLSTESWIGT
jgi:tRNA(fMet)-specific endonuclease VapC